MILRASSIGAATNKVPTSVNDPFSRFEVPPFGNTVYRRKARQSATPLSHLAFSGSITDAEASTTQEFPDFTALQPVIVDSTKLLSLKDDWDGEGSPGYSTATWERAIFILLREAEILWRYGRVTLPAPGIQAGPDGSIDLHWKLDTVELLINIPANTGELFTYYGDSKVGQIVKGSFGTNMSTQWLMLWLIQ